MEKRNHYTNTERREAVELARRIGTREAAEEMGISYSTLCTWRRGHGLKDGISPDVRKENIRLEEENQRLWEANRILQSTLEHLLKKA